jgi:hypothetical protein
LVIILLVSTLILTPTLKLKFDTNMEFPDNRQLDIMWSVATSSAIETREKPHRIFAKLLYCKMSEKDIDVKLCDK